MTPKHARRAVVGALGASLAGCLTFVDPSEQSGETDAEIPSDGRPTAVETKWELENGLYSQRPVVGTEAVFTRNGEALEALDPDTGRVQWRTGVEGQLYAGLGIGPHRLYGGGEAGILFALDRETGDEQWRFALDGDDARIRSEPLVTDGMVAFEAGDGTLYGLDAETGEAVWQLNGNSISIQVSHRLGATTDSLFVTRGGPTAGTAIRAIEATTGEVRWRARDGSAGSAPPAVVDGTVLASLRTGCAAYDLETGDRRWAFQTFGTVRGQPTTDGSRVFVGADDNNVWAVDFDDGTELWRYQTDGSVERRTPHQNGVVIAASDDDVLYFLDAVTGDTLLEYQTPFHHGRDEPVVDGDMVYLYGNASLHALEVEWEEPE